MVKHKPTILITGVVSLLGEYLVENLKGEYRLIGTTHKSRMSFLRRPESIINISHPVKLDDDTRYPLDITNSQQVNKCIQKIKPDIIIHLAAVSNIDFCEKNPQIAKKVNVAGTRNLVQALKNDFSSHFIFLSSSMVFDGNHAPYSETDQPNPINIYGKTKAQAEEIILDSQFNTTIIRSATMYGWPPALTRRNNLPFYLEKFKHNETLYLVNDHFYNPVSAAFVAQVIKKVIAQKYLGILHVGGQEKVNRYEFVKTLAEVFKIKNPKLTPVRGNYFADFAPRPIDATLSVDKLEKILKLKPESLVSSLKNLKIPSLKIREGKGEL